ncbi:MAG: hypothetical protein Q4B17_08220 [Lautropia sp.]|nr:hypothetical protein [Lautropia sp.]
MNSPSSQRAPTDLLRNDMVNDPRSPDSLAASGHMSGSGAVRLALALGSAAVLAACSSTGERPSADYSGADTAVSSAQGPLRSPAAERVVGGIVDMVLSPRLVSTIDEARKHPVGTLKDGQPLYLYIQSKRPLGELAHPADPYARHSFSSHPHLFVQIGDNHSMRILNTCYVTLTPAEAKGHGLIVPLAPLSKRVGDVPSDCWLETVTQADPVRQTLEVRLAGFPGRFESWLPVPDLLGVEAVDVDLRRGAGTYAGMLRADPKAAPALMAAPAGGAAQSVEAERARALEASRREAMKVAEEARKRQEREQAEAMARQAREQKAREQAEAVRLAEERRQREQQAEAARQAEQTRLREQAALAARRAEAREEAEKAERARRLAAAGSAATGAAAAVGSTTGAAATGVVTAGAAGVGTVAGRSGKAEADGKPAASGSKPASSPGESARAAARQAQAEALASRRMMAALPAGARLAPVTPLLPARPRHVGGTRMAVQLRSLTATLLGRQPSETYFTDRQWKTEPGARSRRDARQTIHAIAVFRGEECSWQPLLVSRRPNANTIAEVAADGDEVPIACPDLDR